MKRSLAVCTSIARPSAKRGRMTRTIGFQRAVDLARNMRIASCEKGTAGRKGAIRAFAYLPDLQKVHADITIGAYRVERMALLMRSTWQTIVIPGRLGRRLAPRSAPLISSKILLLILPGGECGATGSHPQSTQLPPPPLNPETHNS
jgi:hypothetical protein